MLFQKTDDQEFPDFAAPRRWNWKLIAASVLLCALAVFSARPVYRWGKAWRARSLAAESGKFLAEKDWSGAIGKAQAAYRLAPEEPATLRAIARFYSYVRSPDAFDFWLKFLALPQATDADRKEAFRFALQFNRLDFAAELCEKLLAANPKDSETLELAVQLAIQKGDRKTALDRLQLLMAAEPEHPAAAVLKAQLLFSSPDSAQQKEGKAELEKLAKNDTNAGLTALRSLAGSQSLALEELHSVAAALSAHPLATTDDQLLAVSLRIRLAPDQRRELIEEAIKRYESAGPDSLVSLGRWANQLGEYQRVTEFISLKTSLTRQDLLLVRLDALAALRRWDEIQRILKEEKPPLEEPHRNVFLARAAQELGEPRAAEARWGDAIRAAGSAPQAILFVAQYAAKVGAYDAALEAYHRLAREPAWTLRADTALIPILEAKGDTRSLRDVIKQIASLAPAESAPRNDIAYLDLLLGENIPAATATAEQLMREHPEMLAHRTTMALAYLRSGNPRAAAQLYKGVNISWDSAPPGWKAVYAAVLEADGNHEQAVSLAVALNAKSLKPEERALVETLR